MIIISETNISEFLCRVSPKNKMTASIDVLAIIYGDNSARRKSYTLLNTYTRHIPVLFEGFLGHSDSMR